MLSVARSRAARSRLPAAWRLPLLWTLLLAAGLVTMAVGSASGSVEPGARVPVHEIHLEPGPLSDACTWMLRVERGDTLSEIAEQQLGTVKRAPEIQRLNPRLDAKSLRVGQALAMPPKRLVAKKGAPGGRWFDFFAAADGGTAVALAPEAPGLLPLGPVRLFAVPHEHLDVLRASSREGLIRAAALQADPLVAVSEPVEPVAADGRALARAVTRLKVTALEGRSLRLVTVEQQLFGATGHRVPTPAEIEEGGNLAVPLLVVLAGLAVFALVAFAARRMGQTESAPAEPNAPTSGAPPA